MAFFPSREPSCCICVPHHLFISSTQIIATTPLLTRETGHKAKNIKLDANGKPLLDEKKKAQCSKTAAAVVELQQRLPNARVVYCSATSVSEPKNLGFMDRLGLWGAGTEHPSGFNQFLSSVELLGCGAMELHAMHLKSQGALAARTLSYEQCDFAAVPNIMAPEIAEVYNKSADLWRKLLRKLEDGYGQREARKKIDNDLKKAKDKKQKLKRRVIFSRAISFRFCPRL